MNKKQKKVIKEQPINNTVQHCQFYGVKWDEPALEVLASVARSLENLTVLFKSQNVEIKTLLNITNKEE